MASDSFQFEHTNLEWQTWTGSIPDGAVGIYNEYEKRYEYVAKSGRECGFYCPTLDQYCHYSYAGKEVKVRSFQILVNKDNFEILEWKPDSDGSVPENAVKTIQDFDTYVGKTYYGLGKLHAEHKVFYYPWGGREYNYRYYHVLTVSSDVINEEVLDVKYKTERRKTIHHAPEIISKTTVVNRDYRPTKQTTTLSESVTESTSWNINSNLTIGASATITAGILDLVSMSVSMSMQASIGFNKGSTQTTSKTKSVNVEHEVPPRHSCTVRMEALMFTADVPFTATLQRTYKNGTTARTCITGTYKGVEVSEVRAVVEPCVPL